MQLDTGGTGTADPMLADGLVAALDADLSIEADKLLPDAAQRVDDRLPSVVQRCLSSFPGSSGMGTKLGICCGSQWSRC
jgi:hypothetical protein